jgi:nucleotide-binding universal stress UspA family protein
MLKILVPIDGSVHSDRIIARLLEIIPLYKDAVELHILNVQHPVPYGGRISSVIGHDQIQKYHHEQGDAALKKSLATLDAAKVPYKHHIAVGDAAEVILHFAREKGCTQIFMGTHGMGAVSGMLLGSVATKVVHLSTIPVTLIRD